MFGQSVKKAKKNVVNVSNKTCRGIFIAVQIAIATQLDVLPLFIFFAKSLLSSIFYCETDQEKEI